MSPGLVLAALDNVPARRYLDSRCVANRLVMLESGTLASKGHVQVVLPGLSESYGSQTDDGATGGDLIEEAANAIPYCTLKSFPANVSHCIEWAREKVSYRL
ncbi:unnamed protein product [Protopolystoma xenopodis]|uniref:THIF-type NAD/FAD binding fold domain-containing protein n=1 Tax=Protopolystoma xenopodis TaxID=117903 RepID=A0A448XL88_9PLAT|nr:unnamed protein product [Protopolystoma xenopodis]